MKQLLQTSTDGRYVVVALYDTVYFYDNKLKSLADGCQGTIYELSSAKQISSCVTPKLETCSEGNTSNTNDDDEKATASTSKKAALSVNVSDGVDPLEVQAVAVTIIDSTVWCAVARYDKSLTLYSITEPNQNENSNINDSVVAMKVVYPCTEHRTAKRISSSIFATVYGQTPEDKDLTVIVAGDVVGDANAYSLEIHHHSEHENDDDDDDEDIMHDQIVTKNRRLLLGHTASMLTSVHIVVKQATNGKKGCRRPRQLILTSDRDEKIRVSRFPESYCIEGYLLGHTAFVSSVAPIPISSLNHCNLCVSVGGDCTIRLWDFSNFRELAVTSTSCLESNATLNEDAEPGTNIETENKNDTAELDREDDAATSGPIPTKVAVSSDGSIIGTIYDDCLSIDFWFILSTTDNVSDDSNFVLHRIFRWTAPGQPFGITFLDNDHFVLIMQEPLYIQHFKIILDTNTDEKAIKDIVLVENSLCSKIQQSASEQDIIMSDGLLEKDEYGCLKMGKMSERRGGATIKPWNNVARKETNAERIRRLRKRRREEQIKQRQSEQS